MPSRQRLGALNAAHDLVKHLGHRLKPFLPEICALVLILLEGVPLPQSCQVMLAPALPCPALPCPALPCPALPCLSRVRLYADHLYVAHASFIFCSSVPVRDLKLKWHLPLFCWNPALGQH